LLGHSNCIEEKTLQSSSREERQISFDPLANVARAVDVLQVPLIVLETIPDLFDLEHMSQLFPIIDKLIDLQYELRISVLNTTDFGVFRPQQRLVLLASKLGLPVLPG
jgi:site-specific DNA-cytosine methylase